MPTFIGIALLGSACLYGLITRLYAAWDTPLWIDESWTAVISGASSFAQWKHEVWLDSNAPLYYFLIWIWPFETTFGLKLFSIVLAVTTALLALVWRPQSVDLTRGGIFAALLLSWGPGVSLFTDARYYALLFFMSTAQTIAFIRLIERPGYARVSLWVGLTTLSILTHYFAASLAVVQGLFVISHLRTRFFAFLPCGIFVIPAFAYLAYHYPRLQLYSQWAWYETVRPGEWPRLFLWPIAGNVAGGLLILLLAFLFRRRLAPVVRAAFLASAVSVAALVICGTLRPMLLDRYLIPMVPGILLGLATGVRPVGTVIIVMVMAMLQPTPAALRRSLGDRAWFGLELPVRHVPKTAKSVSWSIVYPGSHLLDPGQMRRLLADALARGKRQAEPLWRDDRADARITIDDTRESPPANCLVKRRPGATTSIC